ncbi:tRNA (adenosine(37)-N6)-threonylcarbamoyltransferase complex dimerization subunit type 1 TsaB [Winogradskya humida]|uniref:tRNA (Adenosine(37)-N6)-threonylcarbamoyltransferase complex dimerization subunit type 1 TsaB n=1 Tax=Winogradskya humida TaxID=113566 RepID=A0ABQ3ZKI3_9ACTN|nr:tRNA (adenosine(37)-N6)-threonylcarbamoyltransferase complex dimerization subunit type 1 TsaB [Actinoplanes humidus]GIE19101.1 tRNA (adenosine(37)-N6)-threonylcarbamoyltransferase complex dimerization subunit type 1 TsaB [Actinoplanes humidus]
MLVLGLDTATPAVTAALAEVGGGGLRGLGERRVVDPRAHGELLAPQIQRVLADAGKAPRDLGAIVAGLGPGPFTGLRVGLATAAAMGQALGIPAYGVCTLDALGRAAGPGRVLVATDARRREVYFATYQDGVRVTGPEVAKPADVPVDAERAVGEGAVKYSEIFGIPIDDRVLYPSGEALIALALGEIGAGAEGGVLTPLYLRRPDAVAATERKHVLQ